MNNKSKLTMWSILLLLFLIFCSLYHSYKLSLEKEVAELTPSTESNQSQSVATTKQTQAVKPPILFDVVKSGEGININGKFYDEAQMKSFGANFQEGGSIHYLSNSFDSNREANEALSVAKDLAPIFNRDFVEGSIRYRGKSVVVDGKIKTKESFELVEKILKEHSINYVNNTTLLTREFEAVTVKKSGDSYQLDGKVALDDSKNQLSLFDSKITNISIDSNLERSKCLDTLSKLAPIFNRDFESGTIYCKDDTIRVDGVLKNQDAKSKIESILKDSSLKYSLNLMEPKKVAKESKSKEQNSSNSQKSPTLKGYDYKKIFESMTPEQQKLAKDIEENITALLNVNKITFKTGSAKLTKKSKQIVKEVADILKKYPKVYIEIAGHTDDVGDDQANLELSQRRVQSVKDELIADGIEAERLEAVGYGESRPLVPNDSKEHRRQNRRVEFHIIKIKE